MNIILEIDSNNKVDGEYEVNKNLGSRQLTIKHIIIQLLNDLLRKGKNNKNT